MTRATLTSPRRRAAFSLMEVLIAMAIFTVGFIAVAAIFPAAIMLQKQTVDDALGQQVTRNAEAVMTTALDPAAITAPKMEVQSLLAPGALIAPHALGLGSRSYTSERPDPARRDLYWVPLVRRDPTDAYWIVYLFILRRTENSNYYRDPAIPATQWANYDDGLGVTVSSPQNSLNSSVPGVVTIDGVTVSAHNKLDFPNAQSQVFVADEDPDASPGAGQTFTVSRPVQAGDEILDSNGVTYRVEEADDTGAYVRGSVVTVPAAPTAIWYGRPPLGRNRTSPTIGIVVLSEVLK